MNRIWITQFRDDFDFSPATEYGDLKVITETEVPRSFMGPKWQQFSDEVSKFLDAIDIDHDYVLLSGNPTQMIVITAAMVNRGHDKFRSLKWMKRERRYVPIIIPLHIEENRNGNKA